MTKLELLASILEHAFGHPVERGKELETIVRFIDLNFPEFWDRVE